LASPGTAKRLEAAVEFFGRAQVNRLSAENRSAEMVLCIANCAQCHASCIEAISYCLLKGEGYAQERHISLLATCADMCSTSADTMLRGADVHLRAMRGFVQPFARSRDDEVCRSMSTMRR